MTKIYYFSGTGNSLWSAKRISEKTGDSGIINISCEINKEHIILDAESVVIVFPSYAYGLPVIVKRFLKKAVFNTNYAAAFATYGSKPLGTMGAVQKIFKKKNVRKFYLGTIPAQENFLAIFGPPKDEKLKTRLTMHENATEEAARIIAERIENRVSGFYPFSAFVSLLFFLGRKFLFRFYRTGKNCNGCGICSNVCPVKAVIMKNNRPLFTKKCELCQACVNICPQRAIKFGRVKYGSRGYCHPSIGINELG